LYCDGWAVPLAMMYHTPCLGKGLLSCKLLAMPAAAAAGVILNDTNHRHHRNHTQSAGVSPPCTLVDKSSLFLVDAPS
jgi:hypothetical protein